MINNIGLSDSLFIRGKVPMTKSEIRALTLVRLKLQGDEVVWDIGAGTGSISIEMALNLPQGKVVAIEKKTEAVELIRLNKEKFNCHNLQIIHGDAPDVFSQLPLPTKAVIGGSGGNLINILEFLWQETAITNLVITAVTLNTANLALEFLENNNAVFEAAQIMVNKIKFINDYQMLQAENPIFIISAER